MALASSSTRAPPPLFLPSIMLLSLLLLLLASSGSHAANTNTPVVLCNANSYSDNDPFAASLAQLLQEMVWSAPWTTGGDVYSAVPSQAPLAYGHAACRLGLGENCKLCLNYAATRMQEICERSVGGSATQADGDCRVRYEQYAFTD
ncbi:unnamed protein product [Urochloa humidicola]